MSRLHIAIFTGLVGAAAASAGQIQIGGPNGITSAYITNPTGNGCVGTCTAGSLGNWRERSYVVALFDGATLGTPTTLSNGSHTGAAVIPTEDTTAPGPSDQMTDPNNGGVTFNLLNDGIGSSANGNAIMGTGLTNNYWASVNNAAGAGTLTIPIGIFGVDKTWVMLNDYYSYLGSNPTITFNFSDNSATPTVADVTDSISLTASSTGYRSAVDCSTVAPSVGSGLTCPATAGNGATVIAGAPITTTPTPVVNGDATLTTSTLWDDTYSTNSGSTASPYANPPTSGTSSGEVMLDDTEFNFGSKYSNDTLVSISFTSALPTTANTNNLTRLALTAITVDQVTPEPSTLALFGSGFGLLGLMRFRRRRNS